MTGVQYQPSCIGFPATPVNPSGISGRRFPLLQSSADAGTPSVPSSTNLTRILTLLLGIQNEYQPPITTPKHHQHPAISAFQRVGFPAVPPTPAESLAAGSRCCNSQRMRYARHSHGGALALHGICGMKGLRRGSAMHALHGSSRRAVQLKCGPECPPRGCRTNCSTTSHTHHPGGLRPAGAVVCRIRLQCAGWGGVSHTQSHAVATPTAGFHKPPRRTHRMTGVPSDSHMTECRA